ncbi:MAG: hypothetical protein GY738_22995 [Pseudoalteromonas sp.]|nr:hypothetical protein [Pseudoalteromonas sp.]
MKYDVDPKSLNFDKLFIVLARIEPPKAEFMPSLPYKTKTGQSSFDGLSGGDKFDLCFFLSFRTTFRSLRGHQGDKTAAL